MKQTVMLNQNSDFRRLYYKGVSRSHPYLVVYAKKNFLENNRIGITVSKKIGKAHLRNRAKRIIRAAYRQTENSYPLGWDFVFVARTITTKLSTNDLVPVMEKSIKSLVACNGKKAKKPYHPNKN